MYTFFMEGSSAVILLSDSAKGDIVIPEKVGDVLVTGVRLSNGVSFSDLPITSLTIPSTALDSSLDIISNNTLKTIKITAPSDATITTGMRGNLNLQQLSALESIVAEGKFSWIHAINCPKLTSIDTKTNASLDITNCPSVKDVNVRLFKCSDTTYVATSLDTITIHSLDDYTSSLSSIFIPGFLKTVNLDEAITTIPSNMFANNEGIETVNAPGVTTIESNAFSYATALTALNAPSIETVGEKAFRGCSSLTSLDMSKVSSIGSEAFEQCSALKSITLSDSLQSFSYNMFNECSALEEITIPKGVKSIEPTAFSNCSGLKTVKFNSTSLESYPALSLDGAGDSEVGITLIFGKDIESINEFFLSGDRDNSIINKIEFEEGSKLKSIGNSAFVRVSISTITLPSTIEEIGDFAFFECNLLTKVNTPDSFKLPYKSVYTCEKYEFEEYEGAYYLGDTLLKVKEDTVNLSIREGTKYIATLYSQPLVENYSSSLKTITMPNSVVEICEDGVFSSLENLQTIALSNSLTKIPNNTFLSLPKLEIILIPNGVTEIGSNAFKDSALKTISMPTALKKIGAFAFKNTDISIVTLPAGLEVIGEGAFEGCEAIESIVIPQSVTSIESSAFKNCIELSSITLLGSVELSESAVEGCVKYKGQPYMNGYYKGTKFVEIIDKTKTFIYIKDGTTTIAEGAFSGNTTVKYVYIPSSVTTITPNEFQTCTNITLVLQGPSLSNTGVNNSTQVIRNATVSSDGWMYEIQTSNNTVTIEKYFGELTEITIPLAIEEKPVTLIGESAFAGNTSITSVDIGTNIINIHGGAFMNCTALEEVSISSSLYMLNNMVFSGCTSLTSVTIEGSDFSIYNLDAIPGYDAPVTTVACDDANLITLLTSTYSNYLWVRGLSFN